MIKPKSKLPLKNIDQGGQYAGMAVFDPGVSIAGMGGQYHRIWGSVSTGMSIGVARARGQMKERMCFTADSSFAGDDSGIAFAVVRTMHACI